MSVVISLLGTGLGDQIEAEPVIRYAIQNDFKDVEVAVSTNYPEIFSHLKNKIKILYNVCIEPAINQLIFSSIPNPNHPIYQLIKPSWCIHPTDWLSLILFNRLIPNENKIIKLTYDIDKISDEIKHSVSFCSVLIHPGVNDIYRTFPDEYWLSIIEEISSVRWVEQITIIGKTIGDKGFNTFKLDNLKNKSCKITDLRNRTSLNDLFYLIDKSQAFITNDSGPMHAAGAFSNQLIVLNSLKHSSYIMPHVQSEEFMKFRKKCLSQKLISDDFDVSMFNRHRCEIPIMIDNILNYAPKIDDICNALEY